MPSKNLARPFKGLLRRLQKSSVSPAETVEHHVEDPLTSAPPHGENGDSTRSGKGLLRTTNAPVQTDEAVSLWIEAYDGLASDDHDLVQAYETVLTAQSSTVYAVAGTVNMFTGCIGPARMELMTSLARDASNKAANNADYLENLASGAELLGTVCSGVGKLLDAYPPAAIILSGVSAALPLVIKPIKARKLLSDCLRHILEQTEWYLSLSHALLRVNWSNDSSYAQHRGALRKVLLRLYKSLLLLELRCVCRFHDPKWVFASLKEMLSVVDWEGELKSLKELEEEVNGHISQYNTQALLNRISHLYIGQTELTKEITRTTNILETMARTTEDWRAEQIQIHRSKARKRLSTLIGKFNTTSYRAHMMRNDERVEGTCQWFCNHEKFEQWLESETDPVLVVSADPGCGKSTLAQYLIETILPRKQPNASISYFFFKDNLEQRKTSNAICSLLHNLFDQQPERAEPCEDQILKYGEQLFTDPELLWEIFEKAIYYQPSHGEAHDRGNILCVLDALDECDAAELRMLLKKLDSILLHVDSRRLPIKFLLTTRGYPEILQQIKVMESRILRLAGEGKHEMDAIQSEIRLVINHRLEKLVRMKGLDPETEKVIRSSIGERGSSQRTYLWVKLVLEVLEANFDDDPEEWARLITNPPLTVFEAYEKLLQRVKAKDKEFVRILVSLVYIARRPLSLREMNSAIEIRSHLAVKDMPRFSTDESFRARVIHACGFFVTVYDGRLFFIHQTAQEFLSSGPKQSIRGGAPCSEWASSIVPQLAHRTLAESCIAYLSTGSIQALDLSKITCSTSRATTSTIGWEWRNFLSSDEPANIKVETVDVKTTILERYEFFFYAIEHWTIHFRLAQSMSGSRLVEDIGKEFIDSYLSLYNQVTPVNQTWAAVTVDVIKRRPCEYDHLPDYECLADTQHTLAEMSPYVAMLCGHVRPLKAAAEQHWNFPNISALPFRDSGKRGQLPDIVESLTGWAVTDGSEVALCYLLDTYPQLLPQCGRLLRDVCHSADPVSSVVLALLEKGVPVGAPVGTPSKANHFWQNELSLALNEAFTSSAWPDVQLNLAETLILNGADVCALYDSSGLPLSWTPLDLVSVQRRPNFRQLVELLLRHGADINAKNFRGATCLATMCFEAEEYCPIPIHSAIQILMELGAKTWLTDSNGYNPLHLASARGLSSSVIVLNEEAESRTLIGHTPLHLACMTFHLHLRNTVDFPKWSLLEAYSPFWDDEEERHYRLSELWPPFGEMSENIGASSETGDTPRPVEHLTLIGHAPNSAKLHDPLPSEQSNQQRTESNAGDPNLETLEGRRYGEQNREEALVLDFTRSKLDFAEASPEFTHSPSQSFSQGVKVEEDDLINNLHGTGVKSEPVLKTSSKTENTSGEYHQQSFLDMHSDSDPVVTVKSSDDSGQGLAEGTGISSIENPTLTQVREIRKTCVAGLASFSVRDSAQPWRVDQTDRPVLIQSLKSSGADVNARDDEGCTPLHYAALSRDLFLVEMLIERLGADVTAKDDGGRTALHCACSGFRYGPFWELNQSDEIMALSRGIIGLLLDNGVDVFAEDKGAKTALDYALLHKDDGIAEFLKFRSDRAAYVGMWEPLEDRIARLEQDVLWSSVQK
ncbi:hypothetical protein JX265_012903 [Neoarthrinium moseri]|uniref:NACHT domain-containing protein n=1 Tax=Neoarthrinium moseri TaxID=1658444 RepID=A0A9P9W9K4_9PEZI|nr:hypothetical protein JX265_012903 [Neoarthrinium moseri]